MPYETLPWDRKGFHKERRCDRSSSDAIGGGGGSGGSVGRWKDSRYGSRGFALWRTHDFHRHPGHRKQGGYQPSSGESGHGCAQPQYSDRMLEDNSCRPSSYRERDFGRNYRGNRGSVGRNECQGSPRDTGSLTSNSSGRQHDIIPRRSVSDKLTYLYHHHSDYENLSSEQINSKDVPDKVGGFDGLGTGHRYDKSNSSIPWKPLIWTRSNNLSVQTSGFRDSSNSRCYRDGIDENNPKSLSGKSASVQSFSEDAAGDLTYAASFEEMCDRKKQRVGWGQGLATYEKKKVEGSDDSISKNGLVPCVSNTRNSHMLDFPDRSLTANGSTAAPSVSCTSSPGLQEFPYAKVVSNTNDTSYHSPGHFQGDSIGVENFELNPSTDLTSSINDFLQREDSSSVGSSCLNSTTMNKLLLLKSDVMKALEKTESQLELFETELKCLNTEPVTSRHCPITADFLPVDCTLKPCGAAGSASKVLQQDSSMQSVASSKGDVGASILCNATSGGFGAPVRDGNVNKHTSNFIGPVLSESISSCTAVNRGEHFVDCGENTSITPDGKSFMPSLDEELSLSDAGGWNPLNKRGTSDQNLSGSSNAECASYNLLLGSNRSSARKASEVFSKLLPTDQTQNDIWETISISCRENVSLVEEKLAVRKCYLRFKKGVLTLKFKALKHLWKEDMRVLSIRKQRAKSQKRFESCSKTSHNGYQKHVSSIRMQLSNPGNFSLVPTTELVDFTSKLLSNSKIKIYRSTLKMPSLILDEKERSLTRFVTNNGLIEDPCTFEKERVMINPWLPNEKELFMEMLLTFGKDFKKIASFIDHKTTADCIEFYYKNHKSESFDKIRKRLEVRKQGRNLPTNTYLVTSGKKWKPEVSSTSLDMLGVASVIAANADVNVKIQRTCDGRSGLGGNFENRMSQARDGVLENSSNTDIRGNGTAYADALDSLCGASPSEAGGSCFTSSVDHGEVYQVLKNQKTNSARDLSLTPQVNGNVDEDEFLSDESSDDLDSVDWTDEEKSVFVQSLLSNGKDFCKISQCIGSKSSDQCKTFFSKARKCLGLDPMQLLLGNEGGAVHNVDVEHKDTKDAWVGAVEPPIVSTQPRDKMDVDLSLSETHSSNKESSHAGTCQSEDSEHNRAKENKGPKKFSGDDVGTVGMMQEVVFENDKNLVECVKVETGAIAGVVQYNDAVTADAAASYGMPMRLCESACMNFDAGGMKEQQIGQKIMPEEYLSAGRPLELDKSCSSAEVEVKAVPGASAEEFGNKCDWLGASSGANTDFFVGNSNSSNSAPLLVEGRSVHSGFSLTPKDENQISLAVLPSIDMSQQKDCCSSVLPSGSLLVGSSIIQFGERPQSAVPSILKSEVHRDINHQQSSTEDPRQKHLLGHHSMSRSESSLIFKGYPLPPSIKKERDSNVDANSTGRGNHPIVQYYTRVNRDSHSNQRTLQSFSNEKYNVPKCHSVAEFSFQPKVQGQTSSDHRRAHSWGSSDRVEHSTRTSDVKLFGQILTHVSPSQTLVPTSNSNSSSVTKANSNSFNLKLADHGISGTTVTSKQNTSNCSGLDGHPVMGYGHWDGNGRKTGVSLLPESALLPTIFPGLHGDFPASCTIDQLKRKDQSSGCSSVSPIKDQRLTDCQVYSNYEEPKTQPFTVDVNHVYSEPQRNSGFETESNYTGISDPVAAIKMHYAAAERYVGQAEKGDR